MAGGVLSDATDDEKIQTRDIKEIIINPDWESSNGKKGDIALVQVNEFARIN